MNTAAIIDCFEISSSSQEILKVLKIPGAVLWQNLASHRKVFTIQHMPDGEFQKSLRLLCETISKPFDPRYPVYLKLPMHELIYKGSVSEQGQQGILLKLPTAIHLSEFREHVRTSFPFGEKSAVVRPHAGDLHSDMLSAFKVHLLDFSQVGLGLYVSEANLSFIKPGRTILLLEIDGIRLPAPLLGEVAYVRKEEHPSIKKAFLYRVGIRMIKDFKPEILSQLLP